MKIWNMYRMRLIGQIMYDAGLNVIPTLGWADEETHKFCFDGIEPGGVYAVGTVGIIQDPIARDLWFSGMSEAIKSTVVLVIAGTIAGLFPAVKAARVRPIEALRAD